MASESDTYRLERDRVFQSWSPQKNRDPLVIAGGLGSLVWDERGRRYLDFSSQLVNTNIGHQHPGVVEAIKVQADLLCTIAPQHANAARSQLAEILTDLAPDNIERVFFTNSGTEANEHAIRMARLHTGRNRILSAYRSYHGATAGSITLTGEPRRWASEPGIPGVTHFWGPYLYRSPFHAADESQETARALAHLAEVIAVEGGHTVAAIIVESVVGTNGILVPPPGYMSGLRALCDEHGIILITDEVMSGFGRTGKNFAFENWSISPDLITFAKGVNCGYVPLGGVLISSDIVATFAERAYPGGLTYSGHPLACAAAIATLEAMESEQMLSHALMLGNNIIGPALSKMLLDHPSVGEVRGMGTFWAIELVRDRATREPLVPFNASGPANDPMKAIVKACLEHNLLPFVAGNRVHVVPPINTPVDQVRQGLAILDEVLLVADSYLTA